MSTYENRDGSPKGPFVAGQAVKVIAKKDSEYGKTFQVIRVNGNAVWLPIHNAPRGWRYWSYEIEAA
jgi:hypothetical protein